MSLAVLKRKTFHGGNPRVDSISGVGGAGFSLNGGNRNVGGVGRFRMVSNVTRTRFRGITPMGSGGNHGSYAQTASSSGSCSSNDSSIVKNSVISTKGMLENKYKGIFTGAYPRRWVKDEPKPQSDRTRSNAWEVILCSKGCGNTNTDAQQLCKCCVGSTQCSIAKSTHTAVISQSEYITKGGVSRKNNLPTPKCLQPYPMIMSSTSKPCSYTNIVSWQDAVKGNLLPANYLQPNCGLLGSR